MASIWTWKRQSAPVDQGGLTTGPEPWYQELSAVVTAPDSLQRVVMRTGLVGFFQWNSYPPNPLPDYASGFVTASVYLGAWADQNVYEQRVSPLASSFYSYANSTATYGVVHLWTAVALDCDVRARKAAAPPPDPGFAVTCRLSFTPDTIYVGTGRIQPAFTGTIEMAYLTSSPGT